MSEEKKPLRYWARYAGSDGRWRVNPATGKAGPPPGEDLAVLRSGLGREAGTVMAMWPFYVCEPDDRLAARDEVSARQKAEHGALALFGLHQQSQDRPMHRRGVSVGEALRHLRDSGRFSEQALDARVNAAATSTHGAALLVHLRGLVTQLRTAGEPLDYGLLEADLRDFQWPQGRARVRRRWGISYYGWRPAAPAAQNTAGAGPGSGPGPATAS